MRRSISRYCGPAAVASVFGVSREEAAARLLAHEPRSTGSFRLHAMYRALGVARRGGQYLIPAVTERWTLAKWLRLDGRDAVVATTSHWLHIRGGEVVEDNGAPKRCGIIRWVILLPRRPECQDS